MKPETKIKRLLKEMPDCLEFELEDRLHKIKLSSKSVLKYIRQTKSTKQRRTISNQQRRLMPELVKQSLFCLELLELKKVKETEVIAGKILSDFLLLEECFIKDYCR